MKNLINILISIVTSLYIYTSTGCSQHNVKQKVVTFRQVKDYKGSINVNLADYHFKYKHVVKKELKWQFGIKFIEKPALEGGVTSRYFDEAVGRIYDEKGNYIKSTAIPAIYRIKITDKNNKLVYEDTIIQPKPSATHGGVYIVLANIKLPQERYKAEISVKDIYNNNLSNIHSQLYFDLAHHGK